MIKKLKTFTFCILIFGFQVHAANGAYENSWENDTLIDETSFHRDISNRIASAKCHLDSLDKASNIAAFGLRLTATNTRTKQSDSVIIIFPNLFYSAYNVSEDKPVSESSGLQIIAVPDLFRGDVLSFQSKKHRLWDFCFWLASKDYASSWGLEQEIFSDAQIICTGNASDMAKITTTGQRRDNLQSVLHCEQLFMYKLLTNEGLLQNMVDSLFSDPKINYIFDIYHTDVRFVFEICTYNDMCQKCFSSCFNLYRELSFSLSKEFFKRISTHSIPQRLGSFQIPLPFEIHISSFRPFFIQPGQLTRIKGRDVPNDYIEFSLFQPRRKFTNNGRIVQFFNPWIAQHIFANEFDNFINSMKRLGNANITAKWDLLGRFKKLLDTNQIELPVIDEIADKLAAQKGIFVSRADICRYVLPFAVELAKHTKKNIEALQDFIKDVAAIVVTDVKWNIKTDELRKLIDDLARLPNQTASILSAINDQQMLLNTMLLLESSTKQSGYYDFKNMIKFGEQINLTKVTPLVASVIKPKIEALVNTLSKEKWSSIPKPCTQLVSILRGILS